MIHMLDDHEIIRAWRRHGPALKGLLAMAESYEEKPPLVASETTENKAPIPMELILATKARRLLLLENRRNVTPAEKRQAQKEALEALRQWFIARERDT